jgi:hypothetical protein
VMADLWADFNKASREASMLRMEPQGYAPWVAARQAIEDDIRADERRRIEAEQDAFEDPELDEALRLWKRDQEAAIRAEEAGKWREALLREWVGNHDDHCGRNKWEHDNYGCSHPLIDLLRETYSDELTAITDYEARLLSRPEASE